MDKTDYEKIIADLENRLALATQSMVGLQKQLAQEHGKPDIESQWCYFFNGYTGTGGCSARQAASYADMGMKLFKERFGEDENETGRISRTSK